MLPWMPPEEGAARAPAPASARMPPPADPALVEIAVVIPAHRQPGLLPEALASVLDQRGAPPAAAVVVDDGCPWPETARTAAAFAAAAPGRVFALRRRNGGLSAARNTGIEFALAAFPALSAIYLLDADNRLHPPFLARAAAALRAAPPEVGWIYPDFDMFGTPASGSGGGAWSLLAHLSDNLCEAGSLVRREVFAAGLRFDETLREGFEDWDFWLRAAARGFRGRHLPHAGFRYRRRPESMLAGAERQRAVLLDALRRRHAALFAPRRLLALEAEEAPRYALFEADSPAPRLLLDPEGGVAEAPDPAAAREALLAAEEAPGACFFPAILCFADPAALALLGAARATRGLFWHAERALRAAPAVAVEIARAGGEELALLDRPAGAPLAEAPLLFVTRRLLAEAAADPLLHPLERLEDLPGLRRLSVTLPGGRAGPLRSPLPFRRLLQEAAALRVAREGRTAIRAGWREEWRAPRAAAAARAYAASGLGTVLPCRPRPGARSIGFVLPLFAHGGVERVVQNQAAVLARRGWRTHLVVLGAAQASLPRAARAAFESVTLVAGLGEAEPDWRRPYFGADTAAFGERAEAADALGLLAGLDAVVNTHCLGAHALMGRLRRLGVRTHVALHLVERQGWGQPIGNPHTALAYEHAYDGVLVISERLRDWCLAQGMPPAKLHLVRNAPGHATPPAAVAAALAARAARRGRLRALFLGRLDPQKGVDRLAAIIAATRDVVEWRVVGRPVLGEAVPELGLDPEPPVAEPAALDALYAWADAVVLPSRFEGVPLVVLEAQRMGCAVLATDAGAVEEILADGADGILLRQDRPEAALVADFAARLRALAADRAPLLDLGRRAAARAAALSWEEAMRGFLDHLDRTVPPEPRR
ncbi:glycosyltransferase [Crenalkalicoccus roseus]|uniref:glycosyltransferase n=1 Tax=Crenalkalicoccus roseus TaxID=1485588 RepID=UPI001080E91A|nr:glycosyltransferase [Crenalkalicoccus roseus]